MEKKHRFFYLVLIASTLAIVSSATFFYIRQLNRTISDNIVQSISEIAEHDKAAIRLYLEICWADLGEIQDRIAGYGCETVEEVEERMNLECAASRFSHIYLLAEDGTVYTDQCGVTVPDAVNMNRDFLSYFDGGREKVVARFGDRFEAGGLRDGNILYGVRLRGCEVGGIKMLALIGVSDISSIQDHMVIDSFIKNGNSRGHSALIDMEGNYIVNINKEVYLNEQMNLYTHLSESKSSELTNEEVRQKLQALETFGFYHSHEGERDRELFYFMPFGEDMDLYFIMSVNEAVFREQSRIFVAMSMVMLIVCIVTVIGMLLALMRYQIRTVRTAEKARSQREFLSNMSHEIRTPLNGLISMNYLMLSHIDDKDQTDQVREWLKKSQSTAKYLLSLVSDILDVSKLQVGKVELVSEPLLVSALVDEVIAMQMDNIESRGVKLTVEQEVTEPFILGDATRIKQILMNILGNAAKFTPAGNDIRFTVCQRKTDDQHVMTIYRCEDTGIGISADYIGQIFDSFSQERGRNTSGIKGTGLGMTISKLLIDAMGGDITVESELNVGSVFTVSLPSRIVKEIPAHLQTEPEKRAEEDTERADEPAGKCAVRILVAEDVELNAEVLLEILDMEGFEAVHARNGQEAVELFRNSRVGEFDVILMDMQMPVMDGCTATREIRSLDRPDAASVRIYACTANTFQEDREEALESGMDDFLPKPIDVEQLLKKMRGGIY